MAVPGPLYGCSLKKIIGSIKKLVEVLYGHQECMGGSRNSKQACMGVLGKESLYGCIKTIHSLSDCYEKNKLV